MVLGIMQLGNLLTDLVEHHSKYKTVMNADK